MIAITTSPPVSDSVELIVDKLRMLGKPLLLFDADGVGGPRMETLIRNGVIQGVLDLSLAELLHYRQAAGPDRLTAAAITGIPQVIGLGGLEASDEALDALGKEIAEKACAARGRTRIVIHAGTPRCLAESLRNWIYPPELIVETEGMLNTEAYADLLTKLILA